ncbi:MAG: FtsX-like permease family protein [Verrucomicrobia bacterium]|nr:FtsX-like permease family protein [Verrucomicrobiota bacterium]
MTFRTLIRRSLSYHWRAHLGVVLGAAIGSAALIGALVVGDSVKQSLRERALARVGKADLMLLPSDRFFTEKLGTNLPWNSASWEAGNFKGSFAARPAAALLLPSVATLPDGSVRVSQVNLVGVRNPDHIGREAHNFDSFDRSTGLFWDYAPNGQPRSIAPGTVLLNEALQQRLGVKEGDSVLFRLHKPSALSREAPITPRSESTATLRLRVGGSVSAANFGDFGLTSSQSSRLNAFVNQGELQSATGLEGRMNFILAPMALAEDHAGSGFWQRLRPWLSVFRLNEWLDRQASLPADQALALAHEAFRQSWSLEDSEHDLFVSTNGSIIELRTKRVFLDRPVADGSLRKSPGEVHLCLLHAGCIDFPTDFTTNAQPLITYLVNLLSAGTNTTPYSMVTAAGAPWTPADMRDDEIIVSQWLADDLSVKPGDAISLVYFDPESGTQLLEHTNTFRVYSIAPMELPWADRTLMPDFPGIEKAESTSDWDAGFPLVHKIRDQDEEYWKQHRGTPKAFITLAAGQKMWANRFGDLTAIRFPIPMNTLPLTPTLSPGERENRSQSQSNTQTDEISATPAEPNGSRTLSPLPAGEGQGEGDRSEQTDLAAIPDVAAYKAALEEKILANLKPEELGFRFEPVREQALAAAEQSQDFGGLFLGFSFFLIAAALLLMAMLFQFGLEQRAPEVGTLLALGFTPSQVRKLLLREGVALAFIGGVLGAIGGLAYARAMLHGLATIWRDAVGASALTFHASPQTLVIGIFAATAVGAVTIWLALRKFVKRPARELLVGEVQIAESGARSRGRILGAVALAGALGLVGYAMARGDMANAGVFFGAGALILMAGLSAVNVRLARLGASRDFTFTPALPLKERENHSQAQNKPEIGTVSARSEQCRTGQMLSPLPAGEGQGEGEAREVLSLSALGLRSCARRRTRSLATIAMLACGSFLIVSIGVFRLDANRDATERTSGTGGFALIGETTIPVVHDLNSESGRDFFALSERDLEGVNIIPFRVRAGDEASCLSLNRAQKPRLLGVRPESLEGRFAFAKLVDNTMQRQPWAALKLGEFYPQRGQPLAPNEIAAIGDANSIQWAMGKKVGDTIDYVDERGQPFKVRIVGAVANSILQGQLLIDEAEFVKRFPGESGYRMLLVDAPSNTVAQVSATLSRAMQDVGLELTPTAQRLAQFNAVQNTYLGTFQVLGGLGLLLGSVGLGIVVLRNVLERRGELALLVAVGFRKPTVQWLLLIENGALLAVGLALGVIAAAVAVLPAVLAPGGQLPVVSLTLTLAAVLINGALWTWMATRYAVRGDLLAALRNE